MLLQFRWLFRHTLYLYLIALAAPEICRAESTVALLVPRTGNSAATLVFDGIVAGIKSAATPGLLVIREIDSEHRDINGLRDWLAQTHPDSIIALAQSKELLKDLDVRSRVIIGGSDISPDSDPEAIGLSLSVDPQLFFEYLQRMFPQVRRVFIVHESKDGWLIRLAKHEAEKRGLELIAEQVVDYTVGATVYRKIVARINPGQDALWLPINGKRLDKEQVLPWLIEESWVRRFVIFSNSLEDVRLGATFGLYPDPKHYGARLLEIAERNNLKTIVPTREVNAAIQLRFARHLGASLEGMQFDLQFPME